MTNALSNDAVITDLDDLDAAIALVRERELLSTRERAIDPGRVLVLRVKHTALQILGKIANEADMKRIQDNLGDEVSKITQFPELPVPRWPTPIRRQLIAHYYHLREPREILDSDDDAELMTADIANSDITE